MSWAGLQGPGKRRVLEDGCWMFVKDLVVMPILIEKKTIDEVEFNFILVWVWITKMPLGLNKAARDMNRVVLEVDADDDDMAVGQYI
jgi:hypothetical protein